MLTDAPLPNTEEGISKYENEYSDEILKIKIYKLLPHFNCMQLVILLVLLKNHTLDIE